ncbi:hypothetical protein EXS71_04180 [Candidatus Uhrbacteria bacterium]|nr:hypothetical protein [Candidatus Uhrbacteria bacterium]
MKKVLWVSRHKFTKSQEIGLRKFLDSDVEVVSDPRPFDDAREIACRFKSGGYDDMVVVAPLSVIAVLCQEGMKPLYSEAIEENDLSKIEFRGARGQGFRFLRFRRVVELRLVFADE